MTKKISKKYEIFASVETVWNALTVSEVLESWMGNGASINPEIGGEFNIGPQGGGKILEIRPFNIIKVNWNYYGPNMIIEASIILEKSNSGTLLIIEERGFPNGEGGAWAIGGSDAGWDSWISHLKNLVEKGEKRNLDFQYGSLDAEFAIKSSEGLGEGLYFKYLKENGAADRAGILPGDEIIRWNENVIRNTSEFWNNLWITPSKEAVNLELSRDNEIVKIKVLLS